MTPVQKINKGFDNVDGLLKHTSINTRKCKYLAPSSTRRRDTTLSLQMSQEIYHQVGNEMGMNVDESKNINHGLSTQLMHSFLYASSDTSSLSKTIKL